MMRRCNPLLWWLPALLATGLLAGCGATVPGTPGPARPDLGKLDVGEWNTTPLTAPAKGTVSAGRILESVRLAEVVINPVDLDPALQQPVTAPIPTPLASVGILVDSARPILAEYGMVAGYSMIGSDTAGERSTMNSKSSFIRVTVLSFPDATAAAAAAQRIEEADFAAGSGNESVDIAGFEEAHSHWRPGVPTLGVYAAHGSFLVALYIRALEPDLTALTASAASVLTAQLPKLDAFTPSPPDRLADLPLDPDGMLSRMVPMRPGQWIYPTLSRRENYINEVSVAIGMRIVGGIVLGPGGVDHEMRSDRITFGIERRAVVGLEGLYRLGDAGAARRYFDEITKTTTSSDGETPPTAVAGPAGVPDAWCYLVEFQGTPPFNRCYLLEGKYVATVIGPDETFVQRRAAAQYALLVNSG